jgi:hypothetical protein
MSSTDSDTREARLAKREQLKLLNAANNKQKEEEARAAKNAARNAARRAAEEAEAAEEKRKAEEFVAKMAADRKAAIEHQETIDAETKLKEAAAAEEATRVAREKAENAAAAVAEKEKHIAASRAYEARVQAEIDARIARDEAGAAVLREPIATDELFGASAAVAASSAAAAASEPELDTASVYTAQSSIHLETKAETDDDKTVDDDGETETVADPYSDDSDGDNTVFTKPDSDNEESSPVSNAAAAAAGTPSLPPLPPATAAAAAAGPKFPRKLLNPNKRERRSNKNREYRTVLSHAQLERALRLQAEAYSKHACVASGGERGFPVMKFSEKGSKAFHMCLEQVILSVARKTALLVLCEFTAGAHRVRSTIPTLALMHDSNPVHIPNYPVLMQKCYKFGVLSINTNKAKKNPDGTFAVTPNTINDENGKVVLDAGRPLVNTGKSPVAFTVLAMAAQVSLGSLHLHDSARLGMDTFEAGNGKLVQYGRMLDDLTDTETIRHLAGVQPDEMVPYGGLGSKIKANAIKTGGWDSSENKGAKTLTGAVLRLVNKQQSKLTPEKSESIHSEEQIRKLFAQFRVTISKEVVQEINALIKAELYFNVHKPVPTMLQTIIEFVLSITRDAELHDTITIRHHHVIDALHHRGFKIYAPPPKTAVKKRKTPSPPSSSAAAAAAAVAPGSLYEENDDNEEVYSDNEKGKRKASAPRPVNPAKKQKKKSALPLHPFPAADVARAAVASANDAAASVLESTCCPFCKKVMENPGFGCPCQREKGRVAALNATLPLCFRCGFGAPSPNCPCQKKKSPSKPARRPATAAAAAAADDDAPNVESL